MNERDTILFDEAVNGLKDYYPELGNSDNVASIKKAVKVPDTGNRQLDYENVRDQVERLIQSLLIDGRQLGSP